MTPPTLPALDQAIRAATERLVAAGVATARVDAELLAAHLLSTTRGGVRSAMLTGASVPDGYQELVDERVRRVPLQHLTGSAPFRGLTLAVGPGVFVPRPETEGVAGAAIEAARQVAATGRAPVVVDLCTGSGAIAAAVAAEVPGAQVHAVEVDPQAHAWADRNLAGSDLAGNDLAGSDLAGSDLAGSDLARSDLAGNDLARSTVRLHLADATTWGGTPEHESLDGTVDVVVSNPPYVPDGMVPVDPEVAEHDPAVALYGRSADGLAVPRAVLRRAAGLLRSGGIIVMEHADTQQPEVLAALATSDWTDARGHRDLADRPRWVTAVRAPGSEPGDRLAP